MNPAMSHPARPPALLTFFALAFGLSWLVWVPAAFASHQMLALPIDPTVSGLLGVFGPLLAAIVTASIYDGRAGLRAFFSRFFIWRVGLRWYLFVFLWPAVLSVTKTALHVVFGNPAPDFAQPPFLRLYPVPPELASTSPLLLLPFVFLQYMVIGSSMGEEPGWRGYALPRLQAAYHPVRASLILGVLWGVWHLPLSFTQGNPTAELFFGWTLLGIIADTILFTWVYNHTHGSLLLALLFHTAIAVTGLFLSAADTHPFVGLALQWGAALLVVPHLAPSAGAERRPADVGARLHHS